MLIHAIACGSFFLFFTNLRKEVLVVKITTKEIRRNLRKIRYNRNHKNIAKNRKEFAILLDTYNNIDKWIEMMKKP